MDHPALSLSHEQQAEWNASDAIIEKRQAELAQSWQELNKNGLNAVQKLMDYLEHLEGQNKRLNRRIDMLETQIRFMDRLEKFIELQKKVE